MQNLGILGRISALMLCAGLATYTVPALAKPAELVRQLPAFPTVVGPIPATAESRPFLHGDQAVLEAAGYVEEEYFLSGEANTYEWDGVDGHVKVVAGPGKYTNRILVRRPRDPKRFSGNIEVNLLNATLSVDKGFPLGFERMVAAGDAWIGMTSKSLTADTLKNFDPVRYAPLDWSNPAPVDKRCQEPTIVPQYTIGKITPGMMPQMFRDTTKEDGLVWDMIGQLGMLLKSDRRNQVLPGFARPKLFVTGISQSALMINTWIVAFHDRYRTADGKPAFDGYMPIVGANMLRIAQCSADVPATDPRNRAPVLDVPVIKIYSEAEVNYGRYSYRPDVIRGRAGVATYEIAGATHQRNDIPGKARLTFGEPSAEDIAKALPGFPPMPATVLPEGTTANVFPWAPTLRAALVNLQQWANKGIAPPRARRIRLDALLAIVRDANGNAMDGLRLPYIEVPTARYVGSLAPNGWMSIRGAQAPFDHVKLATLYGNHTGYVRRFSAATDAALAARLLLADDARAMKLAASESSFP